MPSRKLQIAIYWGAGCGGCDIAVLDTNEFVLELADMADIRFWPIAVDAKYQDVEALPDGLLDAAFFSGAVRNSENEQIAKLLRKKSKLLVALGSCSHLGGVPGLANQCTKKEILDRAYLNNPSIQEGNRTVPRAVTHLEIGDLEIPHLYRRVYKLDQVVDVDYYLPGCPPAHEQVEKALRALIVDDLPPRGAVIGAGERALCDDCPRKKEDKKIKAFHRPYELIPDPERCLLEQGILCCGAVTRTGCGARCTAGGVPCRGCYGPPPHVVDQGAKLASAVASMIDSNDPEEIERILADLPDFIGYAYRFGLPASLLQRSVRP